MIFRENLGVDSIRIVEKVGVFESGLEYMEIEEKIGF